MTLVVNGAPTEVPPGASVAALVAQLGARPSGTAVAVNGAVVPRSAWPTATVSDGDTVEVLTAVQGG